MIIEGPPVRAVPESIRKRPTPHLSPFIAGPECLRSRAPPPPEVTPSQQMATWPGTPADPSEVNDTEMDEQRREPALKPEGGQYGPHRGQELKSTAHIYFRNLIAVLRLYYRRLALECA